ncbi:anaerobic carbon-monoxide dehydrogenase catalytic subunit [Methanocaldococcus sp.]|uniref:anaerobic carbon-monoxide dehydrogenase catalytic subunit n=1 Tax=Methanocaldococcus sp. TaxID=2152917 RepID=UPI00260C6A18|nr:anaerobic carbon-monoxide dehydrogenase catalytic subunit [Methanocaldococcus sp.]MCQ6253649.1 anaerobic carbon-monoxide dehydrogenase catalytic subunit [Methanocaldococcus sp.]
MKNCITAIPEIKKMVEKAKLKGIETPHTRFPNQFPKCPYGLKGVYCILCANGPCRITEKTPYGVCGATADVIVARNLCRAVAAGTSCYVHCAENAARALLSAGKGEGSYEIRNEKKLRFLAKKLGFDANKDAKMLAVEIAEFILEDMYKPRWEKSELVPKLCPEKRLEVFKKLDILPGGAKGEIVDALTKTSTNLNSNPMDLLVHCLRLGLHAGFTGLLMTCWLNDILFESPKITVVENGFSSVKPNNVNIMITGHQHALIQPLCEAAMDEELIKMAKEAGADSIKIIGATCNGQDMETRIAHLPESFVGYIANNFTTEPLVATGLIDAVVSEFNCTFHGLKFVAEKTKTKLICIDDMAYIEGAEYIPWEPENAYEKAKEIIKKAIEAFKERKNIQKDYYDEKVKSVVGVGEESLIEFLGGSVKPLIDLIANGKIKGVVGVVGCSNIASGGHDNIIVTLTKELIKRDILVLAGGCVNSPLKHAGLFDPKSAELAGESLKEVCKSLGIPPVLNFGACLSIARIEQVAVAIAEELGVDIPDLPVAASAPQWLEEQALADATYAVDMGFTVHVSPVPFVTGSELVTKVLTSDVESLTGGRLIPEPNPYKAAEILESVIMEKRKKLGI